MRKIALCCSEFSYKISCFYSSDKVGHAIRREIEEQGKRNKKFLSDQSNSKINDTPEKKSCRPLIQTPGNVKSMVFVQKTLCISCESGILIWNLMEEEKEEVKGGEESESILYYTTYLSPQFSFLHQKKNKTWYQHLTCVNNVKEPTLAAVSSSDNLVHVWNLQTKKHDIIALENEDEGDRQSGYNNNNNGRRQKRRQILGLSSIRHSTKSPSSSSSSSLAIAIKCITTQTECIELWSCTDLLTRIMAIPLPYNLKISSFVMIDEGSSWIIADSTYDKIRVFRNGEYDFCLIANPNRMDFSHNGGMIAWIGRGSNIYLQKLETLEP